VAHFFLFPFFFPLLPFFFYNTLPQAGTERSFPNHLVPGSAALSFPPPPLLSPFPSPLNRPTAGASGRRGGLVYEGRKAQITLSPYPFLLPLPFFFFLFLPPQGRLSGFPGLPPPFFFSPPMREKQSRRGRRKRPAGEKGV